jgi:hypothetical protein
LALITWLSVARTMSPGILPADLRPSRIYYYTDSFLWDKWNIIKCRDSTLCCPYAGTYVGVLVR